MGISMYDGFVICSKKQIFIAFDGNKRIKSAGGHGEEVTLGLTRRNGRFES
jgi:hypothetical protein